MHETETGRDAWPRHGRIPKGADADAASGTLDRLFAANPDFSSAEADLLAACILEARGRLPEALSAYERLCRDLSRRREAKGRMALLLQRTGAEQQAGRDLRRDPQIGRTRAPRFIAERSGEWYEIARRHA